MTGSCAWPVRVGHVYRVAVAHGLERATIHVTEALSEIDGRLYLKSTKTGTAPCRWRPGMGPGASEDSGGGD